MIFERELWSHKDRKEIREYYKNNGIECEIHYVCVDDETWKQNIAERNQRVLDGNEMNDEAIFEYKYFDRYFTDNNRDAFFVREQETDKLLGFVMINTYMQKCDNGHSIAEFMVIPKYRRRKIGKNVAFKCFDMYKENWKVSPSYNSQSAYSFWKRVIDEYTNSKNEFADGLFIFENK